MFGKYFNVALFTFNIYLYILAIVLSYLKSKLTKSCPIHFIMQCHQACISSDFTNILRRPLLYPHFLLI
jgi:hypothetical protein